MKPENNFIKGVHKYLLDTYAEKMCNPYRAGIPDVWYSGFERDLWVEYKYRTLKNRNRIVPTLSAQQLYWIKNRKAEGRTCWVIVGMHDGGVIIKDYKHMEEGIDNYDVLSRKELAGRISLYCNTRSPNEARGKKR